MLDNATVREALKEKVIPDIGFVCSLHNVTYDLMKPAPQATLWPILSSRGGSSAIRTKHCRKRAHFFL